MSANFVRSLSLSFSSFLLSDASRDRARGGLKAWKVETSRKLCVPYPLQFDILPSPLCRFDLLSLFDFQESRRNQAGNRDICSQEIVLSPRLPVADRWTGHKFKLQLLWFFKYCSVHSPLVFDAFAMLPFPTARKEAHVYTDNWYLDFEGLYGLYGTYNL